MPADTAPERRFEIREFRDGDEAAILELFARSFHAVRSKAHFDWKYRRNPWGTRRITLALTDAGALVGHYAGYPVPFWDGGVTLVGNQIGDTMTDPSVRHVGRGPTSILGRTALRFYETFCRPPLAFNFGFNVDNIQRFSLRFLRSDRVEPVTFRVRDLERDPLDAVPRLARAARGWKLEVVSRTDAHWDDFFARVAPRYGFLVRRDAEWVRWRYLDCPDGGYHVVALRKWGVLAGWGVFRMRADTLVWGDALFDPIWPEAPGVLLAQVVAGVKARRIEAWFPPRPDWFDAALRELRFETIPEPQNLSLMSVPFAMTDATTRMRESLYYAMGDGDLF